MKKKKTKNVQTRLSTDCIYMHVLLFVNIHSGLYLLLHVSKEKNAVLYIHSSYFTYLHHPSENRGVVHRAAVPAPMSELVLALSDAGLGTFADVLHVVLVELAQLLLALRQTHQLAAQRLCTDDVGLRNQ